MIIISPASWVIWKYSIFYQLKNIWKNKSSPFNQNIHFMKKKLLQFLLDYIIESDCIPYYKVLNTVLESVVKSKSFCALKMPDKFCKNLERIHWQVFPIFCHAQEVLSTYKWKKMFIKFKKMIKGWIKFISNSFCVYLPIRVLPNLYPQKHQKRAVLIKIVCVQNSVYFFMLLLTSTYLLNFLIATLQTFLMNLNNTNSKS